MINPTGAIGPSIGSGLSTTSKVIADLLNGGVYPAIIDMAFPYVDVRDVGSTSSDVAEWRHFSSRDVDPAGILPT